jgi:hypothetical protein
MSTTINPTHTSAPTTSRASSNHPPPDSSYTNGHHHHHHHHHEAGASHQTGSVPVAKKGKQKKVADNSEASKLIAAKISQLELDAAGEKDQEAEIGWFDFPPCSRTRRTSSEETTRPRKVADSESCVKPSSIRTCLSGVGACCSPP